MARLTSQQRQIVSNIELGAHRDIAARAAGLAPAHLVTWMRLGRDPESGYHAFRELVLQAEATSYMASLRLLAEAAHAGEDLRSIRWFLERRFPRHFNEKAADVIDRERERICDVIESLAEELGDDAVDRVLAAIAGEDSLEPAAVEASVKVH